MPRCEMCGAETDDDTRVKVEGAELRVCDDCADHGTTLSSGDDDTAESTKYSTESGGQSDSSAEATPTGDGGDSRDRPDPFEGPESLAPDYGERIRAGREERGLSQADLADALDEKQSRIRKLERGDILPDEDIQQRIERHLGVDLSGGDADGDWEGSDGSGLTLGDVVRRD